MSEDQPRRKVKAVIVIIHGIRDRGQWQQMVSQGIESDEVVAIPLRYGRIDTVSFLFPWFASVRALIRGDSTALRTVERELRNNKEQYPDASLSILAHSFGTYIVSKILVDNTDIRVQRIVLCGSVVKQQFRWDVLKERIGDANDPEKRRFIVNDCGSGDYWPAIAELVGWDYGAAGTDGFSTGLVTNRFHKGGHGLFMERTFVETYWKPFFHSGKIIRGAGEQAADICQLVSGLRLLNGVLFTLFIRLILLLILAAPVGAGYWYWSSISLKPIDDSFKEYSAFKSKAVIEDDFDEFRITYSGEKVQWICYVIAADANNRQYSVKSSKDIQSEDETVVRFKNPDEDFKKFIVKGTAITIRAKIGHIDRDANFLIDAVIVR